MDRSKIRVGLDPVVLVCLYKSHLYLAVLTVIGRELKKLENSLGTNMAVLAADCFLEVFSINSIVLRKKSDETIAEKREG